MELPDKTLGISRYVGAYLTTTVGLTAAHTGVEALAGCMGFDVDVFSGSRQSVLGSALCAWAPSVLPGNMASHRPRAHWALAAGWATLPIILGAVLVHGLERYPVVEVCHQCARSGVVLTPLMYAVLSHLAQRRRDAFALSGATWSDCASESEWQPMFELSYADDVEGGDAAPWPVDV